MVELEGETDPLKIVMKELIEVNILLIRVTILQYHRVSRLYMYIIY